MRVAGSEHSRSLHISYTYTQWTRQEKRSDGDVAQQVAEWKTARNGMGWKVPEK